MHVDKQYLDKRLKEFLDMVKTIGTGISSEMLSHIDCAWSEEIGSNFSIGAIRQLMRESHSQIKPLVSNAMFKSATNAEKAARALTSSYYETERRYKLAEIICESNDTHATNHAAYVLTHHTLWLHTSFVLWSRLPERSLLLSFLVKRNDAENAQNALRWAKNNKHVLHHHERNILTKLASSKASR